MEGTVLRGINESKPAPEQGAVTLHRSRSSSLGAVRSTQVSSMMASGQLTSQQEQSG